MSSSLKNLSDFNHTSIPNGAGMRIGIVVAEWNIDITGALRDGAIKTLLENGVVENDIVVKYVPGSFELTFGAQLMCEDRSIDAVITIGCVIQGETRHFDFICDAVAHGVTNVSLKYNKPVILGVLTPNTLQQAQDRAGGKHGNKGDEAAVTALKMLAFKRSE
ncbi:MAG: 6,7-dimethyl-8-ribityllumazine synthase [Bacteroidetes bacterium]|nr:6,7-dimethyl-8-ribityllumazine synthase [Bacteroidota bacterium]